MALKGVSFESSANEIDRVAEDGEEGGQGEIEYVPNGITSTHPLEETDAQYEAEKAKSIAESEKKRLGHKNKKSVDTTATNATNASIKTTESAETSYTTGTAGTSASAEPGVEMSTEELLSHRTSSNTYTERFLINYHIVIIESGIIVFNVRNGELSEKARLEVLLDDGYWPAFSTVRARSSRASWDHVGEGFIKELDFGRVWFRLNRNDDGDKDDIVSEFKLDAKVFLEQAMV